MKPSVTYLWPSIAAGVDLQAPPGVNDELARSAREVFAMTRVPGFEQMHFASTHNDHVPLLREHASKAAVDWWLESVSLMFFATVEQAFSNRLSCPLEMTGHIMVARDGDRRAGLKWESEHQIKLTPVIAPIFASISREAWEVAKFPSTNWYSDNIICHDLNVAGYQHFVSRAYVHHAGSQTIGVDFKKSHEEPRAWIMKKILVLNGMRILTYSVITTNQKILMTFIFQTFTYQI